MNNTQTYSPDDPQAALGQLADEFLNRHRRGENPRISDYANRHPQLAPEIRRLFPTLIVLEKCGSTVEGSAHQPSENIPERVGEYRVVGRIGEGGMGVVYEAVQESLGRRVALKFLRAGCAVGSIQRERFLRETQAAARLSHPHIVTVYGTGECEGMPYYAMQLIRGRGLETRIADARDAGNLPKTSEQFRWIAGVGVQVADALAYAHQQGVTHRDIKPSNLLLGDTDAVWVADFGLAHVEGQDHLTASGGFVGTRQYMAPEQYNGWSDPRTDVYSLGVTLYELLTLTPAFEASTPQAVIRRVLDAQFVPPRRANPAVPHDLETIVLKAMAAEPAHRYQTARAMAEDLQRFAEGRPITARRMTTAERVWRWGKRNKLAAGLLVALGVLMVATTVASVWAAVRFDHMRKDSDQARDTIERQFADAQRADREAKEQLSKFLLRSAQAELAARRAGGRPQALAALREAAALSRQLDLPAENRTALRREYVAALSTIDIAVRQDQNWELPDGAENAPMAYSRNGTRFAVAERDGELSVRAVATNQEVRKLRSPGGPIHLPRFSPSGRFVAALQENRLHVWDVEKDTPILTYAAVFDQGFDFLPDDSGVVFADHTRTVHVHPFRTGARRVVKQLAFRTAMLRVNPAGTHFGAVGASETAAHVVSLADGTIESFPVPRPVGCFAWSATGQQFAVGGQDRKVYVYRVAAPKGDPLALEGHTGLVVNVAFHPRDDILVSASWDQTVRVWDLTRPAEPVRIVFSSSYQSLEFSADGRSLGIGRDGTRAWVWELLLPAVGHTVVRDEALWGSALSPDGRWLAGMGLTGLHLWELRPGAPPRAVPLDTATTWGRRVWFAPDGQSLTVGTGLGVVEYALRVGDDGRPRLSRSRRWWTTMGVDHWWSPDRTLLAVVPEKRYADVYEWPAEQKPRFTVRHLDRLEYLSFTPDNRLLAGGAWQRPDVKVWDAKTGNVVTTFKTVPTARPIFSPDGRWLVIGTGAAYQFHETDTWKPGLRIAREDCGHNPATGAFTPDGATFAAWSRPGVVTLFDTRDGRELVSLPVTARTGSFDTHGELQFTHDGRKLLVVADMRHVQVWDIADLRGQLATVGLDWESAPAAK